MGSLSRDDLRVLVGVALAERGRLPGTVPLLARELGYDRDALNLRLGELRRRGYVEHEGLGLTRYGGTHVVVVVRPLDSRQDPYR